MDMVSIGEFIHELRPIVTETLPDQLQRAIVRAAKRFCLDTNIVIVTSTLTGTVEVQQIDIASQWETDGSAVAGMTIANIVRLTGDDNPLYVGVDYSEPANGAISVSDAFDVLEVIASMQPDRSASELPAVLYNDWLDAICAGAASYLYTLPAHQDGNLHQFHEREYIEQMRKAKRWRLESLSARPFSPTKRNREFF